MSQRGSAYRLRTAQHILKGLESKVRSRNTEPVTVHHSGIVRKNSIKRPSRILSSYLSTPGTSKEDNELPDVEGGETPQLTTIEDRWLYQGPNFIVDFKTEYLNSEEARANYDVSRKEASRSVDNSLGHFSGTKKTGSAPRIFSASLLSSYMNSRRCSEDSIEVPTSCRENTPPLTSLQDQWIYQEFSVYASTSQDPFSPSREASTSKDGNKKKVTFRKGFSKAKPSKYDESATVHQPENKPKSKRSVVSGSLLSSYLSSKESQDTQDLPSVEGKEVPFFATLEDRWLYHGLNLLSDIPTASVSPRRAGRTNRGDEYVIRDIAKAILFVVTTPKDSFFASSQRRDGQKLTFGVATHTFMPSFDIHVCENWSVFSRLPSIEGEVKLGPDMKLGNMAGDIDNEFHLKTTTGEDICTIKLLEMGCCPCDNRSYQIIPATSPTDLGGIAFKDCNLFITFPLPLDIQGRAMLLACAIIMQYQIEEAASGVYGQPGGE